MDLVRILIRIQIFIIVSLYALPTTNYPPIVSNYSDNYSRSLVLEAVRTTMMYHRKNILLGFQTKNCCLWCNLNSNVTKSLYVISSNLQLKHQRNHLLTCCQILQKDLSRNKGLLDWCFKDLDQDQGLRYD